MPRDSKGRLCLGRRRRRPDQAVQEQRWRGENAEAFAQYNRRVAEEGLLSDEAGLPTDHEDDLPQPKACSQD
jgi:Post-segregation antitoxin CcdA